MKFFYSLLFFILFTNISLAENSNDKISTAGGIGVMSCYEYLKSNRYDFGGKDYFIVLAWAQGFMSAKNTYANYKVDLFSLDIEEQIIVIRLFCEEHKRSKIYNAIDFLYEELWRKGENKSKK